MSLSALREVFKRVWITSKYSVMKRICMYSKSQRFYLMQTSALVLRSGHKTENKYFSISGISIRRQLIRRATPRQPSIPKINSGEKRQLALNSSFSKRFFQLHSQARFITFKNSTRSFRYTPIRSSKRQNLKVRLTMLSLMNSHPRFYSGSLMKSWSLCNTASIKRRKLWHQEIPS